MMRWPSRDALPIIFNHWYAIAAVILNCRRYASILTRISYLGLLLYWHLAHARRSSFLFNDVMGELMRWKTSTQKETDALGRHYTLNIAEIICSQSLNWIFWMLFPNAHWAIITIVLILVSFLSRSSIVQLWTHKQMTWIIRTNATTWMWRGLAFESTCLYIIRRADTPATRAIMHTLWYMGYKITVHMPSLLDNFLSVYIFTWMTGKSNSVPKSFLRLGNYSLIYWIWFRDLGLFMNLNPPVHKYAPLLKENDVRVILLYPRLAFQPIKCTLLQGSHKKLLFYEAISYTWGDVSATEEILVDGCRKKVTKSVYGLLASYSSLLVPKLLWIDALCIDQDNDEEKSQQVQMMGSIYLNACFVTVWLGREFTQEHPIRSGMQCRYDSINSDDEQTRSNLEDARIAFDLLNELEVLGDTFDSSENVYETYEDLASNRPFQTRRWKALLKLLRQPFFERVWVVQEVTLGDVVQVCYGNEIITWDVLGNSIDKLHRHRHFRLWLEWTHGIQLRHVQHTSLYNIARINGFREKVHEWRKYGSGLEFVSFDELLADSFYFKASDPKDLIYGLNGICKDPVEVDYTQSVEQVYLNAAKKMGEKGNYSLLFHAASIGNGIKQDTNMKLPSWVPDWRHGPKYARINYFKAGGGASPKFEMNDDSTLSFTGFRIDNIAEIGPTLFDTEHQSGEWSIDEMGQLATRYFDCLRQLTESTYTRDPYPHRQLSKEQQSLHEAFLFMIGANIERFRYTLSWQDRDLATTDWEEDLKGFLNVVLDHSDKRQSDAIYKRLKRMDNITERVRHSCGGRRVFVTKQGYIGLGPPYAVVGDLIHVVPGVGVPILIRRIAGERNRIGAYGSFAKKNVLVGECYIHGLMNGEALSMRAMEVEMDMS